MRLREIVWHTLKLQCSFEVLIENRVDEFLAILRTHVETGLVRGFFAKEGKFWGTVGERSISFREIRAFEGYSPLITGFAADRGDSTFLAVRIARHPIMSVMLVAAILVGFIMLSSGAVSGDILFISMGLILSGFGVAVMVDAYTSMRRSLIAFVDIIAGEFPVSEWKFNEECEAYAADRLSTLVRSSKK